MRVEVEMWAFAGGKIRVVTIPDLPPKATTDEALDLVFCYGQNECCLEADWAQRLPSVSTGDVIRYHGHRFVICGIGFQQVAADWKPALDPVRGTLAFELYEALRTGKGVVHGA